MQLSLIGGLEFVRILQRRSPSTAIIILSEKDEDNFACIALKEGVSGFLLMDEDIEKLALIVKIVYSSGLYISASIISRVIGEAALMGHFPGQLLEQVPPMLVSRVNTVLSPTERNIATGLANGLTDNQIAKNLNYSEGSITNMMTAMKRKTNLKSRIEIVLFALLSGQAHIENHFISMGARSIQAIEP
jgi:DNA-binding NarL/FixJ family response regulator